MNTDTNIQMNTDTNIQMNTDTNIHMNTDTNANRQWLRNNHDSVKFSVKLLHDNTARGTKWETNNHIRAQHQQVLTKNDTHYPRVKKIVFSSSIYLAWQPPHESTLHGEFLGYRLTYRAR